jgi:hypothetical protein
MEFDIKLSGDDLNAILAALKGNTERIMGSLTAQANAQATPPEPVSAPAAEEPQEKPQE